jgi:hypothetical protein
MLINKIEKIIDHINGQPERLSYNERIYNILEGNLKPEILASLNEQLSANAYQIAKERVSPLNILKRIVSKLSRVYSDPAQRTATSTAGEKAQMTDQELIDWYVSQMSLDVYMGDANKFFNALKTVLLQIYYISDKQGYKVPRVRVIPPHRFTVISENKINPLDKSGLFRHTTFTPTMNFCQSTTTAMLLRNAGLRVTLTPMEPSHLFILIGHVKS